MSDLNNLSAKELKAMISNAEKALKNIETSKRKEVIAQIKELAASIDMSVDLRDLTDKKVSQKKTTKVAIKYRDPENSEQTWTGRGVMPRWLKAKLDSGSQLSDFAI